MPSSEQEGPTREAAGVGPEASVTAVIRQQPRPDALAQYEAWLKDIVPAAQSFAGHRGVNIIRPPPGGAPIYTIVLHFDTLEHLTGWLESEMRARLIEKLRPLLAVRDTVEITTGLEFWFTPAPGQRHAKPHKQFLVTLSAIFPLTILVPWAWQPAWAFVPWLGHPLLSGFIIAATIVGLMTYVIMPRYVRLIAGWLYR